MKLFLALSFLAVAVFGLTQGAELIAGSRTKRALAREDCPLQVPLEKCRAYAEIKSKQIQYCHEYSLYGRSIQWSSCGTVFCGQSWMKMDEDLTLPYPYCCSYCVLKNDVDKAKRSS